MTDGSLRVIDLLRCGTVGLYLTEAAKLTHHISASFEVARWYLLKSVRQQDRRSGMQWAKQWGHYTAVVCRGRNDLR